MSQEKCPGDICMTTYVTKDGDEKDSTFGCATAQCTQPFRGGCRSTTNGGYCCCKGNLCNKPTF
ncbi:GRANULINS domain-containing protein [Caenorhabditis elegans]|uniref:GRANULINS domain-containing protein n=1 Tax=Caenorhabditis elegans TaxID=6239 RepID=Q9N5W6_CAEEL|nr:GRANULINS domain-containing protein [Caenorhabditis elegans]CCD67054.2 GRANULINS domain-containing protein [Caenorhabditis elegans]